MRRDDKALRDMIPADDPGFSVELIDRDEYGYLQAIVSIDGDMALVSRRYGSWQTIPDETGRCKDILPRYAARLELEARRVSPAEITDEIGG
jgi:hypothetical protein